MHINRIVQGGDFQLIRILIIGAVYCIVKVEQIFFALKDLYKQPVLIGSVCSAAVPPAYVCPSAFLAIGISSLILLKFIFLVKDIRL